MFPPTYTTERENAMTNGDKYEVEGPISDRVTAAQSLK